MPGPLRRRSGMERLALSLWIGLTAVTLAGSINADRDVPTARGFPKLPVPAGDLLTEARGNLARSMFYDRQVFPTNDLCCGECTLSIPT